MPKAIYPFLYGMASAWFTQFLKVFYYRIKTQKWNWKILLTSGGMPSSHTAGFAGLATIIYLQEGITTSFSIALAILALVMYDAVNVRWFGGVAAQKITELTEQLWKRQLIIINKVLKQKSKSILGHKITEVLFGFIIGISFSSTLFTLLS